jgi:hypothetical protein
VLCDEQQLSLYEFTALSVAQVKTKDLKPPADIVEAIQNSEDGSTAPPEAEVRAACM